MKNVVDGIEITQTCADCVHCLKLYVPPCYKDIPDDRYVCNALTWEVPQVMYIGDDKGFCECFAERIHPLPFEDESEDRE